MKSCPNNYFSASKLFLMICLFFILGIIVSPYVSDNIILNDFLLFLLFVISVTFFVLVRRLFGKRVYILLLVGFLFFGMWRYSMALPVAGINSFGNYIDREVMVTGFVKRVDKNINSQKIVLITSDVNVDGSTILLTEKLLIFANRFPEYAAGDILRVSGKPAIPEAFDGFDYDVYLASRGIFSLIYYPEIEIVDQGRDSLITTKLGSIKNKIIVNFKQGLTSRSASLASAMLVGDKSGIDEDLRTELSHAGISHVVAISGMHIGILVLLLMWLGQQLGFSRKGALIFIIIFILIYLFIIGFPASAIRASIMGAILLSSYVLGRPAKLLNMLIFAATLMLLINPFLVVGDMGFVLSFGAVLGIVLFYFRISAICDNKKIPRLFFVRDIIILTLSAQLLIVPIIINSFGVVSLTSFLSNVLIVVLLPTIMILLVFISLLGLFFFWAPLFFIIEVLMQYVLLVVKGVNAIPGGYVEIGGLSTLVCVVYYLFVVMFWYYIDQKNSLENKA